jgi:hypothetical protein
MPTTDLPQVREPDPSPQLRFRSDALFAAFLCLCAGQSLDPQLVASRGELSEFFRLIGSGESVEDHPLMTGWRREAAGQSLVELLDGKMRFSIEWGKTLQTTKGAGLASERKNAGLRGFRFFGLTSPGFAQHVFDPFGSNRSAEEVALQGVAADLDQVVTLGGGFDTFSGD